jgi:hypothetical protein
MTYTATLTANADVAAATGCWQGERIEVDVDVYLEDRSFDHEFGTEVYPLEIVIEGVRHNRIDLYKHVSEGELTDIEKEIKAKLRL